MPFEKGHPGYKPKGMHDSRALKRTVREIVEEQLGKGLPSALLDIAKETRDIFLKTDIYKSLLPYTYPKLQQTQITATLADENTEALKQEINELTQELIRVKES